MTTTLKRIICFFLILFIAMGHFVCVHAEEETPKDTVNIIDTFYVTTTGVVTSIEVPYDPNWFKQDPRIYDHDLAKLSLGLATSAFRPNDMLESDEKGTDYNLTFFLYQAGFEDFRSDDYDKDPSRYTVSTVMGHRSIGEGDEAFELIAVGICGQGYLDEWESNFSIGTGDNPDGFDRAAQLVYDRIFGYISANHLSGNIKIWISGFSRAAAIANITAARLSDSDAFSQDSVFAYTFATPMTTREEDPGTYENIFNICGKTDPVTTIPFADWGYTRYGTTFYTPALETDSDFAQKRIKADEIFKELTHISYWTNTEISGHLRMIMDSLLKICPDVETYAASLQDNIIYLWENHDPQSILSRLLNMANDPLLVNEENRQDANMFLNHISALIFDYLDSTDSFRRYNRGASLGSNILQAHTPELYFSWIFSVDNGEDLYTTASAFSQVYIDGDVTVSLCKDGEVLETLTYSKDADLSGLKYLGIRNDKLSVLVPGDEEYVITISSHKDQTVSVLDADFAIGTQAPLETKTNYYEMKAGKTLEIVCRKDGGSIYSREYSYNDTNKQSSGNYYDSNSLATFAYFGKGDISWRDAVLALISISILTLGFLFFVLALVIIYLRFRHRRKTGVFPKDMRFRPLPILCSFMIQQLFLTKEFYTALYEPKTIIVNAIKILIGVLLVVIAFYGYRRRKDRFHIFIMPVMVLLTLADVMMTYSLVAGALLHTAAYILLCYDFIREERPEKIQIIIWGILSLLEIIFIVRTQGSFGFLRVIAVMYVLSATAVVVSAFTKPGRTFRGAILLFISGFLLMLNTIRGTTFLSHILASGLYYVAAITLASSGSGILRQRHFIEERKEVTQE